MDQVNDDHATALEDAPVQNIWAFPLSFSQQRLWLLDQLEPGNTSYSIPWSIRLTGVLHQKALADSLNEIVRRHESLRTTFRAVQGEPSQIVAESLNIPLPLTDLTMLAAGDPEAEALRIAQEEALQPIDLENGPLLRARLIRLGESEHLLLITLHHIVFDGWSRRVFARELAALYEAFRDGQPSPLHDLPLQYADYVVWQRNHLKGKVLAKQLGYWKRQLAGSPASLNLPTDRPRPALQSYRGSAQAVLFSLDHSDRINAFAREHGASLFMVLLAAFQVILSRYSGEEDILIGTPIANRTHAQTENLIGLFANTLVLRANLSGDPTFTGIVSRVKQTALDAYANQDVPFEKLVEELNPERSLSHNPLFQVIFSLQNAARQAFELSGLDLKPLEGAVETSKFDLSVYLSETPAGIRGRIEYSTDLFNRDTVERLWGHYGRLLEAVIAKPGLRLSEMPLLTAGEHQQLLETWNDTVAPYPAGCLHEWFERQVERSPESVASVFEGTDLSYRELNERANQLGRYLRRLGVGPGQRVGIFVERSHEMLVGLLGIQKSGAAYVPVDPGYPAERIRQILEQAQVAAIVTEADLECSLPPTGSAAVPRICLAAAWPEISREGVENLSAGARAEDPVYVIFTSGSTGRPKGVEVPHRAVVNLLASMARELSMGPDDVFPALASFAFDMCIPELYLALVTGGRVALGRARLAADGVELAAFLKQVGATVVHATPTTWRLLLDAGFTGQGLKRAIGAEALPAELCSRLLEADPSLYNFYGPTETTVWSTMHHFRSPGEAVVVGRPLANTQIYILDQRQQPVPVGIEGELYIGGAGVANGYLHQPELTAERFGADPFHRGGRMYRTGDRARYRSDGRIEYLGRADHQVKLRGYRMELGEIETVLAQHPAVAQSVAAVREDTPGDQRLVAYVVAQAGALPAEAALRSWVRERLPEYMVPVRVVTVERFALTPNGKVDRKQLPAVDYRRLDSEQGFQGARTPVEEVIAGIWAEVLKLDRVGVEDDFFQLGGHSLLGTQVVSRVREALRVELPLRALFEAPTVRGLAKRVEGQRPGRMLPPLERGPRPERLPLSFAQQRLWFLDQLEPGNALYNVPYLVRLTGRLDVAVLEQSLNEIVRRHEILRTRFVMQEDEPGQVIDEWQPLTLKRLALADGSEEERLQEARRLVLAEMQQPFDLTRGPLVRGAVLALAAEDHVFLLNTHHIISDRWSLGVLAEELGALYEAYRDGRPSPLAELPVQYADYALWQRRHLDEQALAPQLAFWKQHLAGAPPLIELPTDRPHSPNETSWGGTYTSRMAPELVAQLRTMSRQERVTFFMTLLASFHVLLACYTGQDDIVVGTDIANRTQLNTEKLFGFFVNLLPTRLRLSSEESFSHVLARVREVLLDAYTHQDVPFDRLVEELSPARVAGRNPLVQVLFVMQNTPPTMRDFGGLTSGPVGVNSQSRFDLVLFVNDPDGTPFATWMYNPNLFDAETISLLASLYDTLLNAVVTAPEVALSSLQATIEEIKIRHRLSKQREFQEVSQRKLATIRRKPRVAV